MTERATATLTREQDPVLEPVTLAEAKLHLRLDSSDEDALILRLIPAARENAERILRRSLMPQRWKLYTDAGFEGDIALPMGPVVSLVRVSGYDGNGVRTDFDPGRYRLSASNRVVTLDGLGGAPAEIIYETGYPSAEKIPAAIRQGILVHVAAMYTARIDAEAPVGSLSLYRPFREVSL